jgi:hypothetical protein
MALLLMLGKDDQYKLSPTLTVRTASCWTFSANVKRTALLSTT